MRGGRGGYNNQRGGGGSGGGGGGGGYYNNSYRMQSSNRPSGGGSRYNDSNHSNHYNNNNSSGGNRYHGQNSNSNYNYENRNRDKFNNNNSSNSSGRYDSGHKRSYDSSRDRRDGARKRPRTDDYRHNTGRSDRPLSSSQAQASSSSTTNYHRSSTGGGGGSSSNNNNNSNSSSYRPRGSSSSGNRHHRSSPPMGPPKRAPIRTAAGSNYLARSRGSIPSRGLRSSIRGIGGSMRIIRSTRESTDLRIMRKKLLYAQQKDRARLLKIQRLTSSLRQRRNIQRHGSKSKSPRHTRSANKRSNSGDDDDTSNAENNDEDDDDDDGKKRSTKDHRDDDDNEKTKNDTESNNKKASSTKHSSKSASASTTTTGAKNKDGDNEHDEEEEAEADDEKIEKNDTTAAKKEKHDDSSNINGTDKGDQSAEVETNEDSNSKEKTKEKVASTKVSSSEKKSGKKKEKGNEDEKKSEKRSSTVVKKESDEKKRDKESDDDAADKKSRANRYRDDDHRTPRSKRTFIKLTCIHCHTKCVTFKEYSYHLNSRTHNNALRQVALRQRADLLRLRARQRTAQREIEVNSKEQFESRYCRLCRLAYRQPKAQHQVSEHHKTIKKFLMPYCSSCHLAFKNSLLYEVHRCSLEHIRNKARNQDSESDNSADEREIDLNKFLTVDSVGEIDNDMDADVDALLQESEAAQNAENADETKKSSLVGSKFITPIEAFYCELCNHYSAKVGDDSLETYSKKHCMQRSHVKAFLRHKEEEERAAKKLAKKTKGDEAKTDAKTENGDDENAEAEQVNTTGETMDADDEDGGERLAANKSVVDEETGKFDDDQFWDDVDKDLGHFLAEVEQLGQDDDDEEDESVLNIDIASEKSKQKDQTKEGGAGTEIKDVKKKEVESETVANNTNKEETVKQSNEAKTTSSTTPTSSPKTAATVAAVAKASPKSAKVKPQPQRKAVVAIRRTKATPTPQK